jgi:apoptosis-inducing factor 2
VTTTLVPAFPARLPASKVSGSHRDAVMATPATRDEGSAVSATIAVIGGGYGGITVARALDEIADVIMIEPGETFTHNVAALRAVADPDWAGRLFISYDGLLTRGQVRRDRAVAVSAAAVELASGVTIAADFTVLATGSTHQYPAKVGATDAASGAERLRATHRELDRSSGVLLLGAGPVGLELAGEIKAAWPAKPVTIVDPRPDLMPGGFPPGFRDELRAQLDAMDVRLVLGTSLREPPGTAAGRLAPFTVATGAGDVITADIWFACYGAAPVTGYLAADLMAARQPDGLVAVTPELRLPGQAAVFAVGDITALPEMKMARNAQQHAHVVAANIRNLIEGRTDLASYAPHPDAIVLPLGPKGGVSYAPEVGVLRAAGTAAIKGGLFLDVYRELLRARA